MPGKGPPKLRLFVAVYPPPEIARALLEELARLELPEHRVVAAEQVHLTLQFIGDTPAKDLDRTIESVRRAARGLGAFELRPQRLITLPERGRRRLVAAEADRPGVLAELKSRLARRLARHARREPADRFRPHFTLCRFRRPAAMDPVDEPLAMATFPVSRVALMKSTLSPRGSLHEEAAGFPLAG